VKCVVAVTARTASCSVIAVTLGSSAEGLNDTESLPSTARHATRRHQAAGTTRAIARTQQSERVRANVNRHRITQARTSQLAPTYLIQSTWLDETINAVIAGLNSSVYMRDLTPRATHSRRSTTKRRKTVKRKKTSSGSNKTASKGVKRKKRRGRTTKSRKKLALKKTTTPRSRIATSLGMAKDKKGSSLPTVYRPSEQTLSGMRADIGAASLSIYGDPFDLDPFVDQDEEVQEAHASSVLEAKRRGISRSALRSHQPVARPVTASFSRRGIDVPQSGALVEAAPVPDLLGSILSGQSMLMMDSSDVVINRDGSLKATKPINVCNSNLIGQEKVQQQLTKNNSIFPLLFVAVMPAIVKPGGSKSSVLSDACIQVSSAMSPNQVESYSPIQPPQAHPRLQPPCPGRPADPSSRRGTSGLKCPASSMRPPPDSSSKHNGIPLAHFQCKKTPTKPMWVDVSVLPRIPKIKRESSSITNGISSSTSSSSGRIFKASERGMNSYTGDKGRQQSVDQRKARAEGEAQRSRSDAAGSSSSFSSSFSSSSAGLSANHPHHTASSSSTSTVSFRINSSGNSWHSRRLSMGSSSGSSSSIREVGKEKKDEARKKQLRRDKQMLLASRTLGNKEEDGDSIYDPFNPTQSDSSSSEDEAESRRLGGSSQNTAHDRRAASSEKDTDTKEETQELVISEEESSRTSLQDKVSMEVRRSKVEKVSRAEDTETEKQTPCDHKVKQESVEELSTNAVNPSTFLKNDSSASNKKTEKAKTRNEFASKSPTRDFSQKVFHSLKEQRTGSSETHRGGRLAHNSSDHAIKEKGENKDRKPSSGHSRVRKRGSARSSSESSSSDSPNRTHSRQSRSQSKDRRLSRSSSSSGSRECSQRRKHNPRSTEERTVKDNRCGPSRSESPPELCCESRSRGSTCPSPLKSHSRSRSRSRERRHQGEPKSKPSRGLRSRSRSKERRKEEESSKSSQKTSSFCVPSSKDVKEAQAKKREDIVPNKEDKGTAGKKQEAQSKDLSANSQAATPATHKKRALLKEIKREKPPTFDIFEESAGAKAVKEEESDICGLMAVKKEEDYKGFKTEACEIPIFKSEASSPESCPSVTLVSPLTEPGGLQDPLDQLQPALLACAAQPDPAEQTVAMRQETQQPSDSDDDFNVDVMLDSLQYEKPGTTGERSEQRSEAAVEGGTASVSKSKNQVKRVTWNIQEPEGPQPEKSPSKFPQWSKERLSLISFLNFLLLRAGSVQVETEAGRSSQTLHRPELQSGRASSCGSLAGQLVAVFAVNESYPTIFIFNTPLMCHLIDLIQDGVGSVSELSKKGLAATVSGFSRSDGAPSQKLSTTELGKDEDLSRKDKYLKKLHMQERAVEEVKLAIKPFYQRRDINKDEYKEILRKAVQKVCHSKSGEINPMKVGNLVRAYVDKYKHARKHKKGEDTVKIQGVQT
uniref:PHD and ring finger domains 1 n=1 Tax=Tetraodon nigroviridis TaxID=99883 RepID=H3BY66_TETNG